MDFNLYALSQELGFLLKAKQLKLSVAESCTGGGLAAMITSVAGSSEWFDCGFVTYSNESKKKLLGVSQETLRNYGAVSEATAREMAIGALRNSGAHLAVSITGIAGPTGGTPEKPVGTVCFGLAEKNKSCQLQQVCFSGGRKQICVSSIMFALTWLLQAANQDYT